MLGREDGHEIRVEFRVRQVIRLTELRKATLLPQLGRQPTESPDGEDAIGVVEALGGEADAGDGEEGIDDLGGDLDPEILLVPSSPDTS